jgi:hypothetical protein
MTAPDRSRVEGEHRGVAYSIGPRTPCPGIGWSIPTRDMLGRDTAPITSPGAFYDGCEDHPEGAYAWAEWAVKRTIDRMIGGIE